MSLKARRDLKFTNNIKLKRGLKLEEANARNDATQSTFEKLYRL